MKMLLGKELGEMIAGMPSASFINEYGEIFVIHSNGIFTFISGDEVDQMVDDKEKIDGKYLPLFSPHFDVWSKGELRQLGKALQELYA